MRIFTIVYPESAYFFYFIDIVNVLIVAMAFILFRQSFIEYMFYIIMGKQRLENFIYFSVYS